MTQPEDDAGDSDVLVTWRQLLAETAMLVADPTHARWICETATSTTAEEFASMLERPASERAVAHLDAMVARARSGEPIQYVLGSWGFRRIDLAVDRRVLIPRPETELLAERAIEIAAAAGPIRTVVDLGTGSGAIGLSMADELPHDGTTVWITDASADALIVARDNLAGLGRAATNVRVAEGSWTDALPTGVGFDVIVSNPPYVADASIEIEHIVEDWEPADALFSGPDGLDDLRSIIGEAPAYLRPGGWLVVEHGYDQGSAVRALMKHAGLAEIGTETDLAGLDRLSSGRRSSHLFDVTFPAGSLRARHLENTESDYAHLLLWRTTAEVVAWCERRDTIFDLSAVLAEYGPGGEHERSGTISSIIELEGEPIGAIEFCALDDPHAAAVFGLADGTGMWSLEMFIGRPDLVGAGIGRAVSRASAEFLVAARGAVEVVVLASIGNQRAIAAYRAAGFTGDQVVPDRHGTTRDMVRLHFQP